MNKVLAMPPLLADSAGYRTFENACGSQAFVPGRHDITYRTPKAQFPKLSFGELTVTQSVFVDPFILHSTDYEPCGVGEPPGTHNGTYASISDGIDVARSSRYWLPVFYRPQPISGLNMVVVYQMLDSAYYGTEGSGWVGFADKAIVKLYHQDGILDSIYPELRAKGPLSSVRFRLLFNCLQDHFDGLFPLCYPEYPVVRYTDLGADSWAFSDKPYRDLIRYCSWITPDSIVVQLYCSPADIIRKYYRWGGTHDLLFDSVACTYRNVPQGTPGAVQNAMDIQWEDLAIWIVYTYIGQKPRRSNDP